LEAERALLGSVLLDNSALDLALNILNKNHFYSEAHRITFEKMVTISAKRRTIDLVTLSEELAKDGQIERAGGVAYLAALTDGVPVGTSVAVSEYSRIIREKASIRAVINSSNNLISRCLEDADDPNALIDAAIQALEGIRIDQNLETSIGLTEQESLAQMVCEMDKDDGQRMFTGIPSLDHWTGGFRAGELVIVTGGQSGVGKTLFARQIAKHTCHLKLHGVFVSCEMLAPHLSMREVSSQTGIPMYRLRNPDQLSAEERSRILALSACRECRIIDSKFQIEEIHRSFRMVSKIRRIDWVVLDYDELLEALGSKSELEKQILVAAWAKRVATEFRCPVLLISQLRKSQGKEDGQVPTLAQLYGSGAKVKHASYVIYVERRYVQTGRGNETDACIRILKNRDGRIGKIDAYFDIPHMRFHEVEKEARIP
jgi:replicative DNA helicase